MFTAQGHLGKGVCWGSIPANVPLAKSCACRAASNRRSDFSFSQSTIWSKRKPDMHAVLVRVQKKESHILSRYIDTASWRVVWQNLLK